MFNGWLEPSLVPWGDLVDRSGRAGVLIRRGEGTPRAHAEDRPREDVVRRWRLQQSDQQGFPSAGTLALGFQPPEP